MSTFIIIVLLAIVSVILIIIAVRFISLAMKNVKPDKNFGIATLALLFLIVMSIIISTFGPNHNKKNILNNKNLTIKKINNKNLTLKIRKEV